MISNSISTQKEKRPPTPLFNSSEKDEKEVILLKRKHVIEEEKNRFVCASRS